MKRIQIKPEHQAEMRFLVGEIFHRERMGGATEEAVRALGRRQIQLYPEVSGKHTEIQMDKGDIWILVFENTEEMAASFLEALKSHKKRPYAAFMGIKGQPVYGPSTPPIDTGRDAP